MTIQQFLEIAGGVEKQPVVITHTKGRCIRVTRNGWQGFTNWHTWSEALIGNGKPCEEFRVEGGAIVARLKTAEQCAADDVGFEIDEKHGELATYWPFTIDSRVPGKTSRPDKKRKPLKGAPAAVLTAIRELAPTGTINLEELIAEAVARQPPKIDVRGIDRRKSNTRDAVAALVAHGKLFVHGDEQELISLQETEE